MATMNGLNNGGASEERNFSSTENEALQAGSGKPNNGVGSSSAGVKKSSAGVSPAYAEHIRLFTPDELCAYTELHFSPPMNFLLMLSICNGSYP